MADQEIIADCVGKLERAIDRAVDAHMTQVNPFKFSSKNKKEQLKHEQLFRDTLRGFMLSGVQIATHALTVEDGRVTPHLLSEAVRQVADKLNMTVVPV